MTDEDLKFQGYTRVDVYMGVPDSMPDEFPVPDKATVHRVYILEGEYDDFLAGQLQDDWPLTNIRSTIHALSQQTQWRSAQVNYSNWREGRWNRVGSEQFGNGIPERDLGRK